ncbi:hypothetical protein [Texcoconibacillus texcoconensis]|uniref:DNA repair exonuclease SbcCD ATPase subunit n=1 Tax=Texcoconibacillus texcoconensis TaxID=1095777 RepID=A0A840QLX9_9BACI|nr:hypothetical protein [Texcoconibacillus texcoconensis]MBB5172363.1 DNA repair exonuclease SbcCD ATPase subunit [Texcoconibacillus texcoconensis]
MPSISKIRFTNVVYEGGDKRYNDDLFRFDGHNGVLILENGGGKTVFIQTAIQAILPNFEVAGRKVKDTLQLQGSPAHIAIEWILSDHPRRYAVTAVTLYMQDDEIKRYRYAYEYEEGDAHAIEHLPFAREASSGGERPASTGEMADYYHDMKSRYMTADTFSTDKAFHEHLGSAYQIVAREWEKIADINASEGDVEQFFKKCETTQQLVDRLLIPTVEQALSGDGSKDFADMLEGQRGYFKEYNQLQEKVKQTKLIQKEIEQLVKTYEHRHEAEKQLTKVKEKAKAYHHALTQEKAELEGKLQDAERKRKEHQTETDRLKRREHALEVAVKEQSFQEVEERLQAERRAYDRIAQEYETTENRYQQLRLAQVQRDMKENEGVLHELQVQYDQLEKDETIEALQSELDEVKQYLRGLYEREKKDVDEKRQQLTSQREAKQDEETDIEGKIEAFRQGEAKWAREVTAKETKISDRKERLATIENELQVEGEKALTEKETELNKRIEDLQQAIHDRYQTIREYENKKDRYEQDLQAYREEERELNQTSASLHEKKAGWDEEMQRVRANILSLFPDLSNVQSLYRQELEILNRLEEKVESVRNEREALLTEERRVFRWVDDYRDNDIFTADPQLFAWVKSWQDQFHYLEIGTSWMKDKLERLQEKGDIEGQSVDWSAWTNVLVVSDDTEVHTLYKKLEQKKDENYYPVIIYALSEARTRLNTLTGSGEQGRAQSSSLKVVPAYWEDNVDREHFKHWKQANEARSQQVRDYRDEKDNEVTTWSQALENVRHFFNQHPHDEYESLQQEVSECDEKLTQTRDAIKRCDDARIDLEKKLETEKQQQQEAESAKPVFEQRLHLCKEGQKLAKSLRQGRIDKQQAEEKHQHNEIARKEAEKELTSIREVISDLKEEAIEVESQWKNWAANPVFEDLGDVSPRTTNEGLQALASRKEALTRRLNDEQQDREVLQVQIQEALKKRDDLHARLAEVEAEAGDNLERLLEFPIYGDDELSRLREKRIELADAKETQAENVSPVKSEYEKKQALFLDERERFQKAYPDVELASFSLPLDEEKERLERVRASLAEQERALQKAEKQLREQEESVTTAIHDLDIANAAYGFMESAIEAAPLSDREQNEIAYQKQRVIEERKQQLQQSQDVFAKRAQAVVDAKEDYRQFCDRTISDPRLLHQAKEGIRVHETYADIREWYERIRHQTERIIQTSEASLRHYHEDYEEFIKRLHAYLVDIRAELLLIPNKTKVRVGEQTKAVYQFTVPEWNEQDGKQSLREQINWMINELDSDKYKDESGKEDPSLIRKAIEQKVQVKQLLRVVMGNDTVKVKCRKVSNDGRLSNAPKSWEESNRWSGGEKWSKNMTLFLGLLNYLAEKQDQVQQRRGKRNRSVIVDNPFGQASSSHVLEPVFFIAEQLGFQIIAVTAHAEGKFVRDYFPVIYSMKLGQAEDGVRAVMQKTKDIKKAYFQEEDPDALIRLGEEEQLRLL